MTRLEPLRWLMTAVQALTVGWLVHRAAWDIAAGSFTFMVLGEIYLARAK